MSKINERIYNDILILDARSSLNAGNILEKIIPLTKEKLVLGLGGGSGTQKSETAMRLQALLLELGIISRIMHLDLWYKVRPEDRRDYRKKTGIIGREEMNCLAIYHHIADFKENLVHRYAQVLIVEGIYALAQYSDYRVHLQGTIEDTSEFRLKRKKEPRNEFRLVVLKKEYQEVDLLKEKADLII